VRGSLAGKGSLPNAGRCEGRTSGPELASLTKNFPGRFNLLRSD